MRKFLFSLLGCLITIGGQAMSFKIEGKIEGLMPGDTLRFERITMPGFKRSFAFEVLVEKQDEFSYKGSHEDITYYWMVYKPVAQKPVPVCTAALTMLIKDGTTRLTGTAAYIYYCRLEGELYENELLQKSMQFRDSLLIEREKLNLLAQEAKLIKDTAKAEEYMNKFNSFYWDHKEAFEKSSLLEETFFNQYPSSEHSIIEVLMTVNSPHRRPDKMYEKMNNEARNSRFGKILKQEIDRLSALQPGNDAPDFRLIALDGKEISLKDCAGSYVLIYHWGLCPGSLMIDKEVIALYNRYKDHLIVIGITDSIDRIKGAYENTQPGKMLKNIELKSVLKNMLAHPWMDAEKRKDNEKIEIDYGLAGLPFFVFISPEGKIIIRDFHKAFYTAKEKLEAEFGK